MWEKKTSQAPNRRIYCTLRCAGGDGDGGKHGSGPQAHLPLGNQIAEIQLVQLEGQDEIVLRQTTSCVSVELHTHLVVIRQMEVRMVTFRLRHLPDSLETSQRTGEVLHLPFLVQRKLVCGGFSQTPSRNLVPQPFHVFLAQYRGVGIARNTLLRPQTHKVRNGIRCTDLMFRVCVSQRLVAETGFYFGFEWIASTDILQKYVNSGRWCQLRRFFRLRRRSNKRWVRPAPRTPPIISEPRARTLLVGGLVLTRRGKLDVLNDIRGAF